MNIGNKIKEYRTSCNLSQEELADKVFVLRQTISNWENLKSYPDIKSITLLCNIFNVSLEDFIEGDLDQMKKVVYKEDTKGFNILSWVFTLELIIMLLSAYPLLKYAGIIGVSIWILFALATMSTAFTIEKFKKQYDIQTYKEIVAFCESKTLSHDDKWKEIGKRPYQKFLLAIMSGILALVIMILMHAILD